MSAYNQNNRILSISFLQFIGVISVIFGHSLNGMVVADSLTNIKSWVYVFHMPLFFFVSAYLFAYKGGYQRGYKNVLIKRAQRLILPYIIWNSLFFFPKYFVMPALDGVSKDKPVELSFEYFCRIILRPRDNILGHTWFLFALFEMFLIAIILEQFKNRRETWIPITMILCLFNCFGIENRWLAIGDILKNCVFFWCGLLVGSIDLYDLISYFERKNFYISVCVLTIFSTLIWLYIPDMMINNLILGFAVIFLLMTVQINTKINLKFVSFVSNNMFSIYILHWPIIMVLRFVFYQKLGVAPFFAVIINFMFGLMIPCLISFLLRKVECSWLKKINSLIFGL